MDWIFAGLGWLLGQSEILSHVADRLLDRYFPPREEAPLRQVEVAMPMRQPPAPPESDQIRDRLIVPPPNRLIFVREEPGPSQPLLAIVLTDGPSSGRVRWVLGRFDVPINLELPANAIALLPLTMQLNSPTGGVITPHDFQYTGMVDGYHVYSAS